MRATRGHQDDQSPCQRSVGKGKLPADARTVASWFLSVVGCCTSHMVVEAPYVIGCSQASSAYVRLPTSWCRINQRNHGLLMR
jgi:hypothetical protein